MRMNEKWEMPSPSEVLDAIDGWRQLDLNSAGEDTVQCEFERVFAKMLQVFKAVTCSGGYSMFYRIRRMTEAGHINNVSDLWAPPTQRKARCNFAITISEDNVATEVSESPKTVLYLSADPANCFEELNVKFDEQVYLIKYKKKTGSLQLRAAAGSVGSCNRMFSSDQEELSYKILSDFLRSEFMKPTCRKCNGSDFIYNVTASICSFLRSVPDVDGFVYYSAVNPFSNNVALFSDSARQKLEIDDVRIVKVVSMAPVDGVASVICKTLSKGSVDGTSVSWAPGSGSCSFRRQNGR